MWLTVSLALLVAALICCIFTAAKGEARLPLWVSVLLVILGLLITHVPGRGGVSNRAVAITAPGG